MYARIRTTLALVAGIVAVLVPIHGGASAGTPAGESADLAAVRAATARYHDVDAALADGYVEVPGCAETPAGGMGIHYVHPERLGTVDPVRPGLLLYVPTRNGGVRLAGVEYFAVDADQDLATDGDRPALFGWAFDGPMPGHFDGQPVHYDLHVWLWEHNPLGMFEMWNPRVSC